ncbi:MAG: hypothetical protein KF724_06545 [Phycisphaeraceae bacterium]|nr:hypothetical protein [Phycisphaeraceae bacterium]
MSHRDIDHLVHALMPAAKCVLARERAMPPMGAEMLPDGEVITRCTHGHGERTRDPKGAVKAFEEEFRSKAALGQVRAVAICMSVTTPSRDRARKTHAICISVEHESGEAMDVYCPYRKGWFGRFRYGEPFSQRREAHIFKVKAHATTIRGEHVSRTLRGLVSERHQSH